VIAAGTCVKPVCGSVVLMLVITIVVWLAADARTRKGLVPHDW